MQQSASPVPQPAQQAAAAQDQQAQAQAAQQAAAAQTQLAQPQPAQPQPAQPLEMGGYFELERFTNPEYHPQALALNCARNCLAYLVEARGIRHLWVPSFLCASVDTAASKYDVTIEHYPILPDFAPDYDAITFGPTDYLYVVDYYGQLSGEALLKAADFAQGRVIIDEVMAFFRKPLPGLDTIYSCRKFFGVPDGAYLYTDARAERQLEQDESHTRMDFVLGRVERPANDYYAKAAANNSFFIDQDIKLMSALTHNLLRGIDYDAVAQQRQRNFAVLGERLNEINQLKPVNTYGAFMYPLLMEGGGTIRKQLQAQKIYVSTLWPYAVDAPGIAGQYARDILPMVVDQRYSEAHMHYEADMLQAILEARG